MRLLGLYHGQNRLRYWRVIRRISQRQLAAHAQVSQAFIWQMEHGRKGSCSRPVAERIAQLLDRPLEDLFAEPYGTNVSPPPCGSGTG